MSQGAAGRDEAERDLRALAQDWIDIWQSELAAMAADRELQESWAALVALWAGAATAMLRAAPHPVAAGADDGAGRGSGPAAPTGAAAAAVPPDARDAEIGRLERRIAQLERRLAGIERGARGPAGSHRGRARPGRTGG